MTAFFPFHLALNVFVALLLAHAALGKTRDLSRFQGVLANYRILPSLLVAPVAVGLPALELALALGLLAAPAGAIARAAAAGLLTAFAAAVAINLLRGRHDIDCGCGDPDTRRPLSYALVLQNLLIAAALVAATVLPDGVATLGGGALGAAAGLTVFLLLRGHEALADAGAKARLHAQRLAGEATGGRA